MGIFCSWALCTPVQKCRYGDSNVDIIARLGGGQAEGEPGRAGERGGAAAVQVSPYSTVQYSTIQYSTVGDGDIHADTCWV